MIHFMLMCDCASEPSIFGQKCIQYTPVQDCTVLYCTVQWPALPRASTRMGLGALAVQPSPAVPCSGRATTIVEPRMGVRAVAEAEMNQGPQLRLVSTPEAFVLPASTVSLPQTIFPPNTLTARSVLCERRTVLEPR